MRRSWLVLQWAMIPTAFGLLLLLGVTLVGWRHLDPALEGVRPDPGGAVVHPAAVQARQFFGWPAAAAWRPLTNANNPFFTLAIQPPPPPKPPPPPPATRKVEVTYRGFFETSARVRRAVIQVADKQWIAGRGDKVLTTFAVTEIELRHLSATNGTGGVVKLEFNKTVPIEIPAQ